MHCTLGEGFSLFWPAARRQRLRAPPHDAPGPSLHTAHGTSCHVSRYCSARPKVCGRTRRWPAPTPRITKTSGGCSCTLRSSTSPRCRAPSTTRWRPRFCGGRTRGRRSSTSRPAGGLTRRGLRVIQLRKRRPEARAQSARLAGARHAHARVFPCDRRWRLEGWPGRARIILVRSSMSVGVASLFACVALLVCQPASRLRSKGRSVGPQNRINTTTEHNQSQMARGRGRSRQRAPCPRLRGRRPTRGRGRERRPRRGRRTRRQRPRAGRRRRLLAWNRSRQRSPCRRLENLVPLRCGRG